MECIAFLITLGYSWVFLDTPEWAKSCVPCDRPTFLLVVQNFSCPNKRSRIKIYLISHPSRSAVSDPSGSGVSLLLLVLLHPPGKCRWKACKVSSLPMCDIVTTLYYHIKVEEDKLDRTVKISIHN